MTDQQPSNSTESRLDRIEAIVEKNSEQIEKNTTAIIDLRVAVSSLIETSNQFQRNFEVIVSEIREIKGDIRELKGEIRTINEEIRDIKLDIQGLQRENRGILDHLFGQQGNEESGN